MQHVNSKVDYPITSCKKSSLFKPRRKVGTISINDHFIIIHHMICFSDGYLANIIPIMQSCFSYYIMFCNRVCISTVLYYRILVEKIFKLVRFFRRKRKESFSYNFINNLLNHCLIFDVHS